MRSTWSVCLCLWLWLRAAGAGAGAEGARGAGGARLHCAAAAPCRYVGGSISSNEQEFSVEGNKIIIDFAQSKYFLLDCNKWNALDSPALPRFSAALSVPGATLLRCPPPAGRALAAALAAFNVTLLQLAAGSNLTLASLPAAPPLAARHFAGLEQLAALRVSASGRPAPAPAAGFLGALRGLRSLLLHNVRLPPGELERPPPALRSLSLRNTGLERPPPKVLALPELRELLLNEKNLADFAVPPQLRTLSLSSRSTTLRVDEIPALESLWLVSWTEPQPAALARCGGLRALRLSSPAARALPPRWVADCPRLEHLAVDHALGLKALPPNLLESASALVNLTFKYGALETLPEELLYDALNLRTLDLTGNRLRTLPSGIFAGSAALVRLSLASNRLTRGVLHALEALYDLTHLSLADNKGLGQLCDGSYGYSRLRNLKKLTSLSLRRTNVTHICRDWRDQLTLLTTLDLRDTAVSELRYADLQYARSDAAGAAEVLLQGAPVRSVWYSRAEYQAARSGARSGAVLHLDSALRCDCDMFWTRLALSDAAPTLRVLGLRCADGRALAAVPADAMLCAADEACRRAALPAACRCHERPSPAGRLVRARCEHAALRRVPRPSAAAGAAVRYDLLLAHNRITDLAGTQLHPNIQELDLSHNNISVVDAATAAALVQAARSLRLDGNPLACDCRAAGLLGALRGRAGALLGNATCAGGGALAAAAGAPCPAPVPPAAWAALAALAALLALAGGAVLFAAARSRRVLLKALLLRWGVLRRRDERGDGRRYDAFVSFAHEDEAAVLELAARLEGGPAPLRLCLHFRDWLPGRYIPDQIVQSVLQSRRTLVLVSRHFLRSTWAQVEFRQAHAHALRDATPRLVLVMLEDPAALPLDAELRRYVARNTYVRWGDPWFWDKLRLALPDPTPLDSKPGGRPAPPAPPAPAAPAPAPAGSSAEQILSAGRLLNSGSSSASAALSVTATPLLAPPPPPPPPPRESGSAAAREWEAPPPPSPAPHPHVFPSPPALAIVVS